MRFFEVVKLVSRAIVIVLLIQGRNIRLAVKMYDLYMSMQLQCEYIHVEQNGKKYLTGRLPHSNFREKRTFAVVDSAVRRLLRYTP